MKKRHPPLSSPWQGFGLHLGYAGTRWRGKQGSPVKYASHFFSRFSQGKHGSWLKKNNERKNPAAQIERFKAHGFKTLIAIEKTPLSI
jgi:hypothetical protein